MFRTFLVITGLSMMLVVPSQSAEMSLEQQLKEVNDMIEVEKAKNTELKAQLSEKENQVTVLKTRLKDLEDKISALNTESNS